MKRLLSMGVSEPEIIPTLRDVGVSEAEAKKLIQEAKRALAEEKISKPEAREEPEAGEEEFYEELLGAAEPEERLIGEEEAEEAKAEERRKPPKALGKKATAERTISEDLSELWKAGVLATVDAKLAEMERIRKELDKVLEERIAAALEREVKKVRAVLESQKVLVSEKINATLEAKAREVTDAVNLRMGDIRKMSTAVQEKLDRVIAVRDSNKALEESVSAKIADLNIMKSRLLSDINSALVEAQGKIEGALVAEEKRVSETDARVNRTLELTTKLTEGILEDAKVKIDRLALAKADELTVLVNAKVAEADAFADRLQKRASESIARLGRDVVAKLAELKELEERMSPKAIQAKIDALEEFREKTAAGLNRKLGGMFREQQSAWEAALATQSGNAKRAADELNARTKALQGEIDTMLAAKSAEFEKRIGASVAEIEALKKKIDPRDVREKLSEMDRFRAELPKRIDKEMAELFTEQQRAMEAIVEKRLQSVERRVDSKIIELGAAGAGLSPETAKERIEKFLDEQRAQLTKKIDLSVVPLQASVDAAAKELGMLQKNAESAVKTHFAEMERRVMETASELDKIRAAVDPENVQKKINELMAAQQRANEKIIAETIVTLENQVNAKLSGLYARASSMVKELESLKGKADVEKTLASFSEAVETQKTTLAKMREEQRMAMEKMITKKSEELARAIASQTAELDKLRAKIEGAAAARAQQGADVKQIAAEVERINANFRKELEAAISSEFARRLLELERRVDSKVKEVSALGALPPKVDIGALSNAQQELEIFKQQFIQTIKRNVEMLNTAKAELAEHLKQNDKAIEERLNAIDAKIKELGEFEQNFAKELGIALEKLLPENSKKGRKAQR